MATDDKLDTVICHGYAKFVAELYCGLEGEKLYT